MLLWQEGADLYAENDDGYSAYDICTRHWDELNPVREVVEAENDRRRKEAFAMSLIERLGADSKARVLTPDTLRMMLTGNFE